MTIFRELDENPPHDHPESGWWEREIERLRESLAVLRSPEARLEKIERYLTDENRVSHFIRDRLTQYAVVHYAHRWYEGNHPEVKSYAYNEEIGSLIAAFSRQVPEEIERIGIFDFYEKHRGEIFTFEKPWYPGNIRILDFLHGERKVILKDIEHTSKEGKEANRRIPIEWTEKRIADLERCREKGLFTYTSIEAVKGGEKIHAKTIFDAIGLLTAWGLQEEKKDKIIADNFTAVIKGKEKDLENLDVSNYRRTRTAEWYRNWSLEHLE